MVSPAGLILRATPPPATDLPRPSSCSFQRHLTLTHAPKPLQTTLDISRELKVIHFHRRVVQNWHVMLHAMRTYVFLFKSAFLHWDWILMLILTSTIVPKSSPDSSDAFKSSQIAPKIDFGGPKSYPKATKIVQDAPELVPVCSKIAPMLTSHLTRMLRRP